MTPEEMAEFQALKQRVATLEETLQKVFAITQHHQTDLNAKAKDLDAKKGQLDVVTDFANAGRVLLQALQHVIAAHPDMERALGAGISQVYQRIEGRALFTTLTDENMARMREVLLQNVVPEVRPYVQLTPHG